MESNPAEKSPLRTTVLLREQDIAGQLRSSFAARHLPEHLFYWLPTSVQAWVDLCRSTEYRNASRALEVLTAATPEMAQRLSDVHTLCGLGCGEGSKDRILLDAFARAGTRLNFVAADVSQALLELAIDHVSDIVKSAKGVKFDVFNDAHLRATVEMADSSGGPTIFSVLGNTLGAFDPKRFPERLRQICGDRDRFLFDGEIFDEATLSGYDNPTNRRFAWGPLTGVGITADAGRLEFSTAPIGEGLFAVTKHFIAAHDLHVNVGGEVIEIGAGEKVRMSSSIKYADEATLLDAVESARFRIESKWKSHDGKFVLACAKPR
jgi:uncharacterized SAM-dependent methyltransferase